MRIRLRVSEEGKEARTVELEGRRLTIGRDRRCDLSLRQILVSRQHAQILFEESGACYVSDLGSRNGLLLNSRPVVRSERLRPGDEIRIGPIGMLVLEVDREPGATDEGGSATVAADDPEAAGRESNAPVVPPHLPDFPSGEDSARGRLAGSVAASGNRSEAMPPGAPLRAVGAAKSWARTYDQALEALRGDFDRLWEAVKSRTPPTLAGEMGSLRDAVEAGMARLSRVAEGIEESNDRLGKLLEAARTISAPQSLRERLKTILDLAIAKMGADCGFLMLYSRRRRSLNLALQRGMADLKAGLAIGEGDAAPSRPSVTIARQALKTGATFYTGLGMAETQGKETVGDALMAQGIHAAICAPMKVEDRFIGLIYVDFRDPARLIQRPLGQEDADWLESLGSLAALAIENARLIEKTRRSADDKK